MVERIGWVRGVVASPIFVPLLLVWFALTVVLTLGVAKTRTEVIASPGRVVDGAVTVREQFRRADAGATQMRREQARASVARQFVPDSGLLATLLADVIGLPTALADATDLEQVNPEIRLRFGLTEPQLQAVRSQAGDERAEDIWKRRAEDFVGELARLPILASADYQRVLTDPSRVIELRLSEGVTLEKVKSEVLNAESAEPEPLRGALVQAAEKATLFGPVAQVLAQRVMAEKRAVYTFDQEQTRLAQEKAAEDVEAVYQSFAVGDVLAARGSVLDEATIKLMRAEQAAYMQSVSPYRAVLMLVAGGLMVGAMVIAVGAYLWRYYPRILTRPWRSAALAALIASSTLGACWISVTNPGLIWLAAPLSTTLVTMVLVVAYDRRLAIGCCAISALFITIALPIPSTAVVVLLMGGAAAAWRLEDIRNRADVVGGSMITGATLGVSTALLALVERPILEGVPRELVSDAALAAIAGASAGAITLFLLPAVERIFNITTGMTLTELRDPRQPLLKLLQQQAPGSYNHSLNVATIAEAAAEAIGADGLHLYVGALYHDCGKLNKPAYFVENQQDGKNRHNKLSPAMSLLVIVGHVKDGMELAREYGLPKSLQHYIESHHGTTLVEYFYHAAKKQADEAESGEAPDELSYRYPGPKPQTREAAILMLCDAVESATRAMSEPTPSRIGALVRELSKKRLSDGQFDDSELTLRELHTIEDTLIKSLTSIYHGRISYPSGDKAKDETKALESKAKKANAS